MNNRHYETLNELPLVLTVPQVADLLGISEQTVRNEAREGRLPAVRAGRKWVIPRDRLIKWLYGGKDKPCEN